MQNATPEELLEQARARAPIASILPALGATGSAVYLVGGTVRDLILGREFVDVDLAVEGETADVAVALGGRAGLETCFGTASVQRGGHRYDLARTRSEHYARPGALPDVRPASIDADLKRRDFTVNALALGLTGARAGELLAVGGALGDLGAGQLSVIHDDSFSDDPTRLLRLARYAARLGFAPAAHTRDLAARAIASGALATVSGTRIGNELRLLATEPDPLAAFRAVADLRLPWEIDAERAVAALEVLPSDGRADIVVLACVFGGRDRTRLAAELDQLGFTAGDRDAIVESATAAALLARRLRNTASRSAIARIIGNSGIETVALASAQGAASPALTWLRDLRHLRLQIAGDDLIERGLEQGPAVGRALGAARDALMDGLAPDREAQLQVALRAAE